MPTFNAANIPTITPGDLFDTLLADPSLTIRWLGPLEPAYYEVLNRPVADIALRQLIIAKAIDRINNNLGFLALFPFLVQPQIVNGSTLANIPIRIFWDSHVSLPDKWSKIRLARVDRLSGSNGSGGVNDSGTLRFIFTGNERTDGTDSTAETALFYADYIIDSPLTYQDVRPLPADLASGLSGFTALLATGEAPTIGGSIVFKTQDTTATDMATFLVVAAPGSGTESYQIVSTVGGGSDAFAIGGLSHGTGLLTSSAYNGVISLESDPLNWVEAFNYPFDLNGTLTSTDSAVSIPTGLFIEFNIAVPANENPTGVSDGTHYPIWISKITRNSTLFTFTFSTYNITDTSPSISTPIEFASMVLSRSMVGGQIVAIEPENNLLLLTGSSGDLDGATQHFGRGHVVLSRKWDSTGGDVDNFFNMLPEVPSGSNVVTFTPSSTRISAFGTSRIPKYIPTKGESLALRGTTARNNTPVYPADDNRYITELDEGLGDAINLDTTSGITPNAAFSSVGYMATRVHKLVNLVVDQSRTTEDASYYDTAVLPRLTVLFGRAPIFGDEWWTGTRFLKYNGNSWVG